MSRLLRMASLAVATGLGLAAAARAQEGEARPTAEHRELAKEAGVWDAEIRLYMQGPDVAPVVSKGVSESEVMPGGLWLTSKFEGKLGDKPFSGRGISGYDPIKKKFVDVWVDSTDSGLTLLEGEYDEATKTLTSVGRSKDPRSGKPYDIKTTTALKGDDERLFTFYMKNEDTGGDYYKLMEMAYKRRGK